jgi:RNA 2',3'-cyclic 3'-phosphodiesterase
MRTFLALPLNCFRAELEGFLERLKKAHPQIKWVSADQVHITLHFFGETSPEQLLKIEAEISSIASRFPPLHIGLEGLDFFPDPQKPRVIWLGIKGDVTVLSKLHSLIEIALQQAGFETEERPFVPHATLGRNKEGTRLCVSTESSFSPTPLKIIDSLVLFKSTLTSKGPIYETLKTFPLSQKPAAPSI